MKIDLLKALNAALTTEELEELSAHLLSLVNKRNSERPIQFHVVAGEEG